MAAPRITYELALFMSSSRSITGFLGEIDPASLARSSPALAGGRDRGWTGRDVVNHMVGAAYLFAAAARGETPLPIDWAAAPDILGDDPECAFVMAVGAATTAFGAGATVDRELILPCAPMLGRAALGLLMADHVTHATELSCWLSHPILFEPAVVVTASRTLDAAPRSFDTVGPCHRI